MLKKTEEWSVEAIWGKIACVSWGDPGNFPVLMVHGHMDTAATFIPIVQHLPDKYYYVAIDLPGHGKSDPFPVGPLISQAHHMVAIHLVIQHLKWEAFVYMAHSSGFIIGILYNYIYPNRISKMVNLDPPPPLSMNCFPDYSPNLWYQYFYDDYYENYSRWELERSKEYSYEQAINLLVRSRKLSKEQSAVVLSRTLVPVGNGKYRLSWEPRMKKVVGIPMSEEMLIKIATTNAPAMLNIVASIDETIEMLKERGEHLMKRLQESIPVFIVINVSGTHDIHITKPEAFVDKINDFLNSDIKTKRLAKL
ncbi:serine hydrolase-like protein [Vanessa atalanta]|uniref:serine hydrolase-like protein n=1 Tax=Vanessa atalanta TaxID=42275 RepID=UPI001FCD992B|nr:serine hydrolase-like protein [Vanessa atalanta]XP_047541963.1 serine hydrolase-like protein [Vanessa atalanta]XP_047541964.1 serine hydrolase-like protein [Vanessa atalanta]